MACQSARQLLTSLIDYAGLFPPAALGMDPAVSNYSDYRKRPHSWMLGRFILPLSRLLEFETAVRNLLPDESHGPWRLSALAGSRLEAEVDAILSFNQRYAGKVVIDSIELKAAHRAEILTAGQILPDYFDTFFEVPIESDQNGLIALVKEIRLAKAHAKVRTGGITPEVFPSSAQLARFIDICNKETVSFKATAGLHHAIRGEYRLTYDEASGKATMHGFLNVFVAAAFMFAGMDVSEAMAVLEDRSAEAFVFDDSGVYWRKQHLRREDLADARRGLAPAFGSCSFLEPVSDLQRLGLVDA